MRYAATLLLALLLFCARSASSESPRSASSAPLQVATPTDFVPAGGAFTAAALLRVDGYAPIPERMEWRNGMALCCGSGYYDGFRLLFHDESEFRPVFEIGRPQGAVALEASSGISTGAWHHVAISWEPAAPSATNGTARLWVDGQLAAVSAPDIPAPILRGEPLKTGYVDFGVGALNGEVAAVSLDPRSRSQSEVAAVFWHMARKLPSAPPILLRESVLALRPPSAPPPEATDASALLESVSPARNFSRRYSNANARLNGGASRRPRSGSSLPANAATMPRAQSRPPSPNSVRGPTFSWNLAPIRFAGPLRSVGMPPGGFAFPAKAPFWTAPSPCRAPHSHLSRTRPCSPVFPRRQPVAPSSLRRHPPA